MTEAIHITGIEDKIAALGRAPTGIMAEIAGQMTGALSGLRDDMATYPAQPTPANQKYLYVRGRGTMYVPTQKIYKNTSQQFGKQVTLNVTQPAAGQVVGTINAGATYSGYVRGTMEPGLTDPAWMHKGFWVSTIDLVAKWMDTINRRMDVAVANWKDKNGL